MSSVLAGRVALERLASVNHEKPTSSHRRIGSLARLAQRTVARVAALSWPRRSPAPAGNRASAE